MDTELDLFVKEAEARDFAALAKASELKHGKALLARKSSEKAKLVLIVLDRLNEIAPKMPANYSSKDPSWRAATMLSKLLGDLLRSSFDLDADAISRLLGFVTAENVLRGLTRPIKPVLRAIKNFAESHELSSPMKASLEKLRKQQTPREYQELGHSREILEQISSILEGSNPVAKLAVEAGEPWADRSIAELGAMQPTARQAWTSLVEHCRAAKGSKPSNTWMKQCRALIQLIGVTEFTKTLGAWFELVGKPGAGRPMMSLTGIVNEPTMISEGNADVLKGLAWAAGAAVDVNIAGALGDLAEVCFKKLPGHGARCPRVGNATLVGLNLLPGNAPVGELTRLRSRVKQPSVRAAVEKAIDRSAAALGVSREDVEEMSTPTYGLGPDGMLSQALGAFTADLAIVGTAEVNLIWRGAGGKTVKSIPAEVKRDHPEQLKALQRVQKDLEKMLPAHARRLERMLIERRQWPVAQWRERYFDHPLLSQLSRRLIWESLGKIPQLGAFHEGKFVSSDGSSVKVLEDGQIRLWHPIDSPPNVVLAWRQWLEQNRLTQPFKQAHREIYILTDAERQTVTYSNRFAAHVLRQHQFHALCQARGWQYRLMGGFDGHNTPMLDLPRHDLRVEFWVDQPPNDELSHAGINLRIVTDQVRFCRRSEQNPMPLEQVDPLVFSESMRDVDLFVGVASVGNDPSWQDGGPQGRFVNYWREFSFGELSASAQTRHAVLKSLLPRLTKIRDRCSLTDRFLVVKGDLRTYKIHLGSGNILMEPNDQYLCIVPSRGTTGPGDVFLPFEGDATLSIILSKAFLLAEDKKIKDQTITGQIGGAR